MANDIAQSKDTAISGEKVSDISTYLSRAKKETGLDDFGGEEFIEPLERIIDALNREAVLNPAGKFQVEMLFAKGLENRLRVENYIRENPEVLDQEIHAPIFISGLPRTGTTALHHLLNADNANHTLRLWEGNELIPPPEDATYHSDSRFEKTKQNVSMTDKFMPGFF